MSGGGGTPLTVKYPSTVDTAPTIVDGAAVVSAIWINFLSELVEAVEAEIGELGNGSADEAKWVGGAANLAAMLNELQIASGSNAGKLKGITKVTVSKIGTAYATVARVSLTPPAARTSALPMVFGTSLLTSGISLSDWIDGPAMVRGVSLNNPPFLSVDYMGARVGIGFGGGTQGSLNPAPTSTKTFTTELTLFQM